MEYKTIDYNKYTKEQLIKLLEISDEGAFHLRNECDALNYRLEKIKDALIEANKKIDKAMSFLEKECLIKKGDIFNEKVNIDAYKYDKLCNILRGEE